MMEGRQSCFIGPREVVEFTPHVASPWFGCLLLMSLLGAASIF